MNKEPAKILSRELKKLSEKSRFNINQLRVLIALERILARITINEYLSEKLIFKGGLVLAKVYGSNRYTRDIDALGQNINYEWLKLEVIQALEKDINDGIWFGDINILELKHQEKYEGLRFDMAFQIGPPKQNKIHKLPRIHLDVGVGDSIGEDVKPSGLQPLIQIGEPISWKVYPPEFIYSEKLETLVKRAAENSRAKDYHDLAILFPIINLKKLISSIEITFACRKTPVPNSFSDFLKTLDLTTIQASWNSQGLSDFQHTIDKIQQNFQEIDDEKNLV